MPNAADYVTLVEVLEITSTPEEFTAVAQAAVGRLEQEGVRELVSIQFFGEPATRRVGALLTFSDRDRMMEHVELVSSWEEFGAFFNCVRPIDVRIYGRLTPAAEAWISKFGVTSLVFEDHIAGFCR